MFSEDSTSSEARLVLGIAQGDREALSALYDRYSKVLYSLAVHILNDPQEADRILVEVFVQIWEEAPSFQGTSASAFGWAVAMTRNRSIHRLTARHPRLLEFTVDGEVSYEEGQLRKAVTHEDHGFDESGSVRTAVDDIPQELRKPLELAFFCGLTHIQIAIVLQQPLAAIKSRIRCGVLQLQANVKTADFESLTRTCPISQSNSL